MAVWRFTSVGQQYFLQREMQGNTTVFYQHTIISARDYNLYSVNAAKGCGNWNKQFTKGWAMESSIVKDSILYVGTSDNMLLVAINPFSGTIQWNANVKFNVFGGPAFRDPSLHIGPLMGELFATQRTTGKIQWIFETENYKAKGPGTLTQMTLTVMIFKL